MPSKSAKAVDYLVALRARDLGIPHSMPEIESVKDIPDLHSLTSAAKYYGIPLGPMVKITGKMPIHQQAVKK